MAPLGKLVTAARRQRWVIAIEDTKKLNEQIHYQLARFFNYESYIGLVVK